MLFDAKRPIVDLDGRPASENGKPLDDGGKAMTFGSVAVTALLAPGESKLSGEEKVKRFLLATRIHGAVFPVEVTVEEAELIKRLVAEYFGPLVTGQVWQGIDGPPAGDPGKAANGAAAAEAASATH